MGGSFGGGGALLSEAGADAVEARALGEALHVREHWVERHLEGYLTHKKQPHPRTLQ